MNIITKKKENENHSQINIIQNVFSEEQVLLAKQRTTLSFMRTGLAFVGIGIAIINFISIKPLIAIGIITTLIGFYEIFKSYKLLREYEKELKDLEQLVHR